MKVYPPHKVVLGNCLGAHILIDTAAVNLDGTIVKGFGDVRVGTWRTATSPIVWEWMKIDKDGVLDCEPENLRQKAREDLAATARETGWLDRFILGGRIMAETS